MGFSVLDSLAEKMEIFHLNNLRVQLVMCLFHDASSPSLHAFKKCNFTHHLGSRCIHNAQRSLHIYETNNSPLNMRFEQSHRDREWGFCIRDCAQRWLLKVCHRLIPSLITTQPLSSKPPHMYSLKFCFFLHYHLRLPWDWSFPHCDWTPFTPK